MPYQNRKPELGKDEREGFDNFVRSEYVYDLRESRYVVVSMLGSEDKYDALTSAVFDKMATPRVFLIDKWRNLSDNERLSYYSKEYQDKAKAEAEAISKKASEALSPMSRELDWDAFKANLDRLTSEALIEIARIIRDELSVRKSKGAVELANYDLLWN